MPGAHAALLEIATISEVDASVRNLAAICFKRGVERNWSRKKDAVPDDEKAAIRAHLLLEARPVGHLALHHHQRGLR